MSRQKIIISIITCMLLLVSAMGFKNNQQVKTISTADSLQLLRDQYLAIIRENIKGREKVAVDSVFKNLKAFGGFPAEILLLAMNTWSRALGVNCTHCHDPEHWEMDIKPEKNIARQMAAMTSKILNEYLRKIPEMQDRRIIINCTSCHNGSLKPALKML